VRKDARRQIVMWIYGGSFVLHVALALGARMLPSEQKTESVAIELADIRKKNEKPKPPPPPPPPPPPEKPKPPPPPPPPAEKAKVAPQAVKEEAPPPEVGADGYADLGTLAMGNAGGGGPADGVPIGAPAAAATAEGPRPQKAVTRKVQELASTAASECNEPLVKPKRKKGPTALYTTQAKLAEIEGVVKVEVTVDETARVISARVLSGLGYGLDENAITAAKAWIFAPASRCGKTLVGTAILPFRFDLSG
jgi:periplasmic protein TonB